MSEDNRPTGLLEQFRQQAVTAKEKAREKQIIDSQNFLGTATGDIEATYKSLLGDPGKLEGYSEALSVIVRKARESGDPAGYLAGMASGSGISSRVSTPAISSDSSDRKSAAHLLRDALALLDDARDTRPAEFDAAVEYLRKVLTDTFGPDALAYGFTDHQLMFLGSKCYPGALYSAMQILPQLEEGMAAAIELTKHATNMVLDEMDPEKRNLADKAKLYPQDCINVVQEIIRRIKEADQNAKHANKPVTRLALALGAGDPANNAGTPGN